MAAAEFTAEAQSLITLFMGPCLGLGREIFERRRSQKKKKERKKTSSVPEEEVKCVPRPSIAPPPGQQTGAQCQVGGDTQTRDGLRSYLVRVSTGEHTTTGKLRSMWGANS